MSERFDALTTALKERWNKSAFVALGSSVALVNEETRHKLRGLVHDAVGEIDQTGPAGLQHRQSPTPPPGADGLPANDPSECARQAAKTRLRKAVGELPDEDEGLFKGLLRNPDAVAEYEAKLDSYVALPAMVKLWQALGSPRLTPPHGRPAG